MRARFSHIRELLRSHALVRQSSEQGYEEREIIALVQASLPESMRPHCIDVSVAGTIVTLFLDSPAWLTRARFLSEQLCSVLSVYAIDEARFKVRPQTINQPAETIQTKAARRLSDKVVAHLYEAADHQSDPRLSEAFRRLAQHHAQRPPADQD